MVIDIFGGFDILVNNVGVIEFIDWIEVLDLEVWGKVIDINVKGVYYGFCVVVLYMLDKGVGIIVNISLGVVIGVLEGWS